MLRSTRVLASGAVALALFTAALPAAADSMDPALERLIIGDGCRASSVGGSVYDPASGYARCWTNDPAFAKLVSQYGAAIAPTAMHAARTTGYGGFRLAFEGAYTTIDNEDYYWIHGTQGPPDDVSKKDSVINSSPDSVLQNYQLKLTKGFPFGVEIAGVFGWLANSSIVHGGADIRVALFEGFRWPNIGGYFPDLAGGGGVRTITGTSQMKLTVASVDGQISKPIPIAGTVILQPHVGYQWLHIWGDSGTIDLTSNTDPVVQCGYLGSNNPATPDPSKDAFDGQPVCVGSSADFNNSVVFDNVRLQRHRLNFGLQLRYQMVHFGLHAITDLVAPADVNTKDADEVDVPNPSDPSGRTRMTFNRFADDPRTEGDDDAGTQWTFAFELGAQF